MPDLKDPAVRRRLALFAILALFGLGAGAGVRFWTARPPEPPAEQAAGAFEARLSKDAAQVWAKLLDALSRRPPGKAALDALLDAFAAVGKSAVAETLAREFLDDPELRSIWREFTAGDRDIDWLLSRLSNSSRFRDFLNRHASDPAVARLAEELARAISKPGETPDAVAKSAGGGPGPSSEGGPGSGRVGFVRGAGAGAEPPSETVTFRAAGQAGDAAAPGGPEPEPRPGEQPGQVGKLAALKAAGPDRASSAWASLCFRDSDAITQDECSAINEHLGEDALWESCNKAELLDRCVQLCRDKTELGCGEQAAAIDRCLGEWPPEDCAKACETDPDCRPPGDPPPVSDTGSTTQTGNTSKGGMTAQALDQRLDQIWRSANWTEKDQRVFNAVVEMVRNRFDSSEKKLDRFRKQLEKIIQRSPLCVDACERRRTENLIRRMFPKQVRP
ncbi:MAG: hypothetical protein HY554_10140 [Elusimicrobia bacterium]|nr:hypothetical protein [Elusimicrobiota bacterium]